MTKRDKQHHIMPEFGVTFHEAYGWTTAMEGASPKAYRDAETILRRPGVVEEASECEQTGTDTFPGQSEESDRCDETCQGKCDVREPHSHIGYVTESDGHTWVTANRHAHSYGSEC